MFKKLKDDSMEKINYYQRMLGNDDNPILEKIIKIMNTWSKIVKTGKIESDDKEIFKKAICETHEYIWFEAGQKLIKLLSYDVTIKKIFIESFNNKNWKPRFNVVALSQDFDKELANLILKIGINDKNYKIREKVADIILSREDKHLLPILEDRLKIETNKNVIKAIDFTLNNIYQLEKDENGNIVFTINK